MNIFWFRRDLRLDDNVGLFHALTGEEAVLPIFIFDDEILSELPKDDTRVTFIYQLLEKMQSELKKYGKSLAVFYGKPIDVFRKIIAENEIKTVFTNHDYEPYARKRDKEMYRFFLENEITFKTCKDQVIFEKDEITKDDGTPYVVYTPYSKKWREHFNTIKLHDYNSEVYFKNISYHAYPFLNLEDIGFTKSAIKVPDYNVSKSLISNYEATRNFPALDKHRI